VKATVVNGWDVRPTLERLVARSSGRIVLNRLITTPGPDPAPRAAYFVIGPSWGWTTVVGFSPITLASRRIDRQCRAIAPPRRQSGASSKEREIAFFDQK
jgi:hypothetical protein